MPDERTRVQIRGRDYPVEWFFPRGEGPMPAVVILHELIGLNDDIRRICRRFRDEGYLVVAPDLANGRHWSCLVGTVLQIRKGRGPDIDLVVELVRQLRERPEVDQVAAAGFCMGGGFALLLGTLGHLDVTAIFYGEPRPRSELAQVCPVVGGYGLKDRAFRGKGRALVRDLEALGKPHDIAFYPQCGHSYMGTDERRKIGHAVTAPLLKVGFNAEAAEDSWHRMLTFFEAHRR